MPIRRVLLVIAALIILTLGGAAVFASAPNPNRLEVYTTWTSDAERPGLEALIGGFRSQHPDVDVVDFSVAVGTGTDGAIVSRQRLAAGNPPDIIQVRTGATLQELIAAGELADVTGVVTGTGVLDSLPDELRSAVSREGRIYALPLAIHRANLMWTNYGVLLSAGIQPSERANSIDEWLDRLGRLRAAGIQYPLALGTGWTRMLLLENVLLADLGADTYAGLWTGATRWDGEFTQRALEHYAALLGFIDPTHTSDDGDAVAARVASGEAAYAVLPDTVSPTFLDAGLEYGTHYAAIPTPGTDGMFDAYVDALAIPSGAPHAKSAASWVSMAAAPSTQLSFASATGAVPARDDIDLSQLPTFQRTTGSSYSGDLIASSATFGTAATPDWITDITKALTLFHRNHRVGSLTVALADAAEDWAPER